MKATAVGVYPHHTQFGPVFVIAHPRSGAGVVCRLVLENLGISIDTDSEFIARFAQKVPRYGDLSDEHRLRWLLNDMSRERFFHRARQIAGFVFDVERAVRVVAPRTFAGVVRSVFEQYTASRGLARWGDKSSDYWMHLPLLRELFPDAQFIHVVRDPRAVAQSVLRHGLGVANSYEAAVAWNATVTAVRRFRATVPEDTLLEIRYEDLVDNPASLVERVASFLGIQDADGLIPMVARRAQGELFSEESTSQWRQRLTCREVECIEAFAGDELKAFGYTPQFRPRRRSAAEVLYWQGRGICHRLANPRCWTDGLQELGVRLRAAASPLRSRVVNGRNSATSRT